MCIEFLEGLFGAHNMKTIRHAKPQEWFVGVICVGT